MHLHDGAAPHEHHEADEEEAARPRGKELARRLLGKTLRMELSDGRIVVGEMQCVDKLANFIHLKKKFRKHQLSSTLQLLGVSSTILKLRLSSCRASLY